MTSLTVIAILAVAIVAWRLYDARVGNLFALGLFAAVSAVTLGAFSAADLVASSDTETWNGSITRKEREQHDCQSGWSRSQDSFCTEYRTRLVPDGETCTTDKDGRRSCVTNYATEYRYDYPWEVKWWLDSGDLKKRWLVDRVDRQGAIEPPKWTAIAVGDPASITNRYSNWVRGAADSVFHEDGTKVEKYRDLIPAYPQSIYDYVKLDRIVPVGVDIPDLKEYNRLLSIALTELGPKRQMNAIVVVSDASKTQVDYAYAVRKAWMGFKKNDAVVFLGVSDGKLAWAEVLSWSKKSIFNVELRDSVLRDVGKPLDLRGVILDLHRIGMESYERREMKEFEFLRDQIPTPLSIWAAVVILNGLIFGLAAHLARRLDSNRISFGRINSYANLKKKRHYTW